MKTIFLFCAALPLSFWVVGQTKVYNNTINKPGKVIFYNSITKENKAKILLIHKYIDTSKKIIVRSGVTYITSMAELRNGYKPIVTSGGKSYIFELKVKKNQLFISMEIYSMAGTFIAKVKDNELKPIPQKYITYVSDKFIEVFDDYHIPILQIDLDKKTNSIIIGCVYYERTSCKILGGTTFTGVGYPKPYLLMSQPQRDSIQDIILLRSRELLKPLHE